jgi:sugar phosphate isomerase/epimerase
MTQIDPERSLDARLCLDPLTVLDCSAEETVDIAAAAGCRFLSFWVQPVAQLPAACLVESAAVARVRRRLADCGVRPLNLEVFALAADTDVADFRPALETGAALGAASATAIFRDIADPGLRLEKFVALCQAAAAFGLRVNAEFIFYNVLGSLPAAADLARRSGQPNAGVVVDILHLMRSGGSPAQIGEVEPRLIAHAQVCDGPASVTEEARRLEGSFNRLTPGEGAFPVRAFCDALPPIPIGVEVPWRTPSLSGLTPMERVRLVAGGLRRTVGEAGATCPG